VGRVDLAVIGRGKCGASELNYVSDVEVVFSHAVREAADAADPDAEVPDGPRAAAPAAELAAGTGRVIEGAAPEPGLS
ncbi:hypothetical protein R0J90_23630, partial [Micrococcus sp. SIMBA_144]